MAGQSGDSLTGSFIPAGEIHSVQVPPMRWLLEGLIPAEGIVLLYGRWGSFKTPLSYTFASAVAAGKPLFGLAHGQGTRQRVLYIQSDTPSRIFLERAQAMSRAYDPEPAPATGVDLFLSYPGFDILGGYGKTSKGPDRELYEKARLAHQTNPYSMVVIDSLRTLHNMPDKDSEVPILVYRALQNTFPASVIMLVHHNRKVKADDKDEMKAESFSGSQAWLNHATVGLSVTRLEGGDDDNGALKLVHTKSQAGKQFREPFMLKVEGTVISTLSADSQTDWGQRSGKDAELAKTLGVSERTARRHRKAAEASAKAVGQFEIGRGQIGQTPEELPGV